MWPIFELTMWYHRHHTKCIVPTLNKKMYAKSIKTLNTIVTFLKCGNIQILFTDIASAS